MATRGNHVVALGWQAPAQSGASAITGYEVTWLEGSTEVSSVNLSSTTLSTTIPSLTNGILYTFKVHATNASGAGADAVTNATPATTPSAPQSIRLQRNPLRITWTTPADDGGSELLSFRITPFVGTTALTPVSVSVPPQPVALTSGQTASTTIPFLPENETYTFQVVASNGAGSSAAVLSSAMTLGCGIPGLPELGLTGSPKGVAIADLDGDGVMDAVISNGSQLFSYLGRGDGTYDFASQTTPFNALTTAPIAVATDGQGMVVVGANTGYRAYQSNSGILTDYGGGGSTTNTTSIALGDFFGTGASQVAIGSQLGIEGPGLQSSLPATNLTAADVDGDGFDDLIVANNEFHLEIFWGSTAGLTTMSTIPSGSQVYTAAIGDFDGDGLPDLATANFFSVSDGSVSIELQTSPRVFGPSQEFPALPGSAFIGVADFNGDGKQDVAVGTGTAFDVLLGEGNGLLDPHVGYGWDRGTADTTSRMSVVDVNSDGHPDVVIADQANRILFFRGNGDGTFPQISSYGSPSSNLFGVVTADFDGDGKADLGAFGEGPPNADFELLLGNGNGTFVLGTSETLGNDADYGVTADFNRDGKPDVAIADWTSGSGAYLDILLGNGDGTFSVPPTVPLGYFDTPQHTVVGDFNEDGNPDLVVSAVDGARTLSLLLGNGDGTFAVSSLATDAAGVVVADFDHDGHLDIATTLTGLPTTFFGAGNGTFTEKSLTSQCDPEVAADFDGDGILDLAGGSTPSQTKVCRGISATDFAPATAIVFPDPRFGSLVAATDVNGDGSPDLVGIDGNAVVYVMLNDGTGHFVLGKYATGEQEDSVEPALGDFNGDGKLDVAAPAVGTNGGTVRVLLQHCFQ